MIPANLPLLANPSGGTVAGGTANITTGPGNVTVNQSSQRAVVNWQQFSINHGETTTFAQPNSQAATLNRVTGGQMSQINGRLNANGQVYLINPHGIVVGKTGRVNTSGGFTASTLDASDAEFLTGKGMTFKGSSSASVVNQGKIKAANGDVMLIARQVNNQGKISAKKGEVHLAGGQEVLVQPSGTTGQRVFIKSASGSGTVSNSGSIRATAAELRAAGGNEYALAVNNSGIIRATGVDRSGGRIVLKAESRGGDGSASRVQNSGRLIAKAKAPGKDGGKIAVTGDIVHLTSTSVVDASGAPAGPPSPGGKGGTVKVGGGFQGSDTEITNARLTVVDQGSLIRVDGGTKGGTVIIWSDGATGFYGDVSAKGPGQITLNGQNPALRPEDNTGTGGFVEVSSHNYLDFRGGVDTAGGVLLLDPSNITISTSASSNMTLTANSAVSSNADSNLNITDLTSRLITNNVVVQTSSSFNFNTGRATGTTNDTASGDILISNNISYTSARNLTLLAHDDIIFNASLTNLGSGGIYLVAGWNGTASTNYATIVGNGNYGYIGNLANSGGNVSNNGGSVFIVSSTAPVSVGSYFGTTQVAAYNLAIRSGASNNAQAQLGIDAATSLSGSLGVTLKNRLTLTGGSGTNTYAKIGHGGSATNTTQALSGAITIIAPGGLILTGGSNTASFAQIGHGGQSFSSLSLGSDISITGTGTISLQSQGASAQAQIGHGGRGYTGGAITGDITIAATSVILGDSTYAPTPRGYAQIGHGGGQTTPGNVNTAAGFSGNISLTLSAANNTLVMVNNSSSGGFNQIGHGGSYAYTGNLSGSISISAATINVTGNAPSGGYAQIGHGGYGAHGGTASGAITITNVATLDVLGNGGYAQIGHGGSTTIYTGALDSTIGITMTGAGILNVKGGSATTTYGHIGNGGYNSQSNTLTGNLGLDNVKLLSLFGDNLSGAGVASRYGQIGHGGSLARVTTDITGNITIGGIGMFTDMRGGVGNNDYAEIGHGGYLIAGVRDITGNIQINGMGNSAFLAGSGLRSYVVVGHGVYDLSARNVTGSITLNIDSAARTLTMGGGTGTEAFVQIGHSFVLANYNSINGAISINGVGILNIAANTSSASVQIGHGGRFSTGGSTSNTIQGDVTINSLSSATGGTYTITAGTGSYSYAQIGHGGDSSEASTISSAILLDGVNSLTLAGNTSTAYAMVGHGGQGFDALAPGNAAAGGNITINGFNGTGAQVTLASGGSTSAYTQIGHGGGTAGPGFGIDLVLTGNILMQARSVSLTGGAGTFAYSMIGHGGDNSYIRATGNITVNNANTVTLTGGTGANGTSIGHGGYLIDASTGTTVLNSAISLNFNGAGTALNLQGRGGYVQVGHGGIGSSGFIFRGATGDISIGNVAAVNVLGSNNGSTGYAQIGHGGYNLRNNGLLAGNITIGTVDGVVTLTGGTGVTAYAQIGHGGAQARGSAINDSDLYTISLTDAASVTLTGGSGNTAYAQIGHGGAGSGITGLIRSGILIRQADNSADVILQGGSNTNSYAQIGHGGFSVTASGLGGNIWLNGIDRLDVLGANSGGGTAYGMLGHGGSGTYTGNVNGNVTVDGSAIAANVHGGTAMLSFARIGNGGATLTVANLGGDISLSNISSLVVDDGGQGSYAQVGHGGLVTVTGAGTTGGIAMHFQGATGSLDVLGGQAYAQVGHGGFNFAAGNSDISGNITIDGLVTANVLSGDSFQYAQIGHGGYNINSTTTPTVGSTGTDISGNINITGVSTGAVLNLRGPSTLGNSFAMIGHGGFADYLGSGRYMRVNSLSGNIALTDIREVQMNPFFGNSFAKIGHGGQGVYVIGGISGNIIVDGTGADNLNLSMPSNNQTNRYAQIGHGGRDVRVSSISGDITINDYTRVDLTPGRGINSFSMIGHGGAYITGSPSVTSADITLTDIGQLNLSALSAGGFAQIGHGGNFSSFGNIAGGISIAGLGAGTFYGVNGGYGQGAYGQIGHGGGDTTATGDITGNITVREFSDLTVQSQTNVSGANAYAQIGHRATTAGVISSDILVQAITSGGTLNVRGSTAGAAYAQVGHGGNNIAAQSTAGDITLRNIFGLALTAGTGESYVQVGHGGYAYRSALLVGQISVGLTPGATVSLQGGTNAYSYAMLGHGGSAITVAVVPQVSGSITVTGQAAGPATVNVLAGNGQSSYAQVGNGGSDSNFTIIDGNISLTDVTTLNITAANGTNTNYARIGHGGSRFSATLMLGSITISGINSMSMTGGGTSFGYANLGHGGDNFTLSAGISGNILIQGNGTTGSLSLVGGTSTVTGSTIGHGGAESILPSGNILGDITIEGANLSVSLTGTINKAQIGHGGQNSENGGITGNIRVNIVGGVLSLLGSPGNVGFAQIGHGSLVSTRNTDGITGNIWITADTLNMQTRSNTNAYVMIGHGGMNLPVPGGISGQISIDISGETSLEAFAGATTAWSRPIIGNRGLPGQVIPGRSSILIRTGTLDSDIATTSSSSEVGTLMSNLITQALPYGGFTLVTSSDLTVSAAISNPASPFTLSLLSRGNLTLVQNIQNTGTGGFAFIAGFDGTSGILGDPAWPLVDDSLFNAPSAAARDITTSASVQSGGDVLYIAGRSITYQAGSVVSLTGDADFVAIADNLNSIKPAYGTNARFTNNGTITSTGNLSVYAVSDELSTLGNLSGLPQRGGIWYGYPGGLSRGINYKLALLPPTPPVPPVDPVDPIDPVDPVIPPLPPTDPGTPGTITADFSEINSAIDQTEEILRRRGKAYRNFLISYANAAPQAPAQSMFYMSTYNLHPVVEVNQVEEER
ncbi:MAG: filamentous hemagglutinin N-terminal domain-containing protein [Candidatus Methylacidiphilales bacterium]